MKKSNQFFEIIYFLLIAITLNDIHIAQNKPIKFNRLSSSDGLSQNKVFDIVQDKLGFIWIGTEDGLNRFDGYEFKVYKNVPSDTTSLMDNMVQTLHISKSGDLWIGSQLGGLSKFNSDAENFINYSYNNDNYNTISGNSVIDISEDDKGNLWIATNISGFCYLDVADEKFYRMENILPKDYEIVSPNLNFIYQDKNNFLWVGGTEKLHVFKVTYSEDNNPRLIPNKISTDITDAAQIIEDKEGTVWIGTSRKGIFTYDYDEQKFQEFEVINSDNLFSRMLIGSFALDENNKILWVGGFLSEDNSDGFSFRNGPGLVKIDLNTKILTTYKNDPQNEASLSSNDVFSLFLDRTGVLWVGTFLDGINKYDRSLIKFNSVKFNDKKDLNLSGFSIRAFYEDDNNLWVSTGTSGLLKYDKKQKKYKIFKNDPLDETTISSEQTNALYFDGQYLWVGTQGGLNKFDKRTQKFKRFYLDSTNFSAIENAVNYNIIEVSAKPGYLWYGSNGGGLVRFNKKDGSFKKYIYDSETQNSLNNRDNYVRTVFYSHNFPNEIWAGTTHGINILDFDTETFRYYEYDPEDHSSVSHQNIMQFYEDKDGFIWVSTYGGGLNRFNPKTEFFERFTESNSKIPNNAVYGVLPDENGNLWLSTNNGISKFDKETLSFKNYGVDDGLQSEEFNGGSYYKNENGVMYFGGIYGFNYFHPDNIIDNQFIPQIVITDLKIFNESLEISDDSPLKKQISSTEEIVLSYWQNDISFEYVALHFANPSKNNYAFKLDNYENEWRYVNNNRVATYTNLDPGEYIFRVKGSNNNGLWNEEGKSIKLTILPPWWKTNWAYLGYVFSFILGVFIVDRIQRSRLVKKEEEKAEIALLEAENERKTKELEEARELQLSMLPKDLPKVENLDIAVYMKTATEVGGDYYDFSYTDDGTLNVSIGDATGHGTQAGILVTIIKGLFTSEASNREILEFFNDASRTIKEINLGRLMMAFSLLKINKNKLQYSGAGMPPMYIYRKQADVIDEIDMEGMPLGAIRNFKYNLYETELYTGDCVLLLSDGYPELANSNEEQIGYERLQKQFIKVAHKLPEEIIDFLKNEGSKWADDKDPDDDVTFVVIKVK